MNAVQMKAPLRRFVWKEYRTLRGLWFGVLLLAIFVDYLTGVFLPGGTNFALFRFDVALAATALYAAGAASILFSIEHEDQTFAFLRGLPTTPAPAFAGKVLGAALSSLALATVLALFGGLASHDFPNAADARAALGVFGLMIFEALAWGTLCSLLLKRPLAAALLTLVLASIAVNLAAGAFSNGAAALDAQPYLAAVPLRLAIATAVFVLAAVIAANWLSSHRQRISIRESRFWVWLTATKFPRDSCQLESVSVISGQLRRAIIARLLWQSVRESWKIIGVPIVVGLVCLGIQFIIAAVAPHSEDLAWFGVVTAFAVPASFGALVFSADQRRRQVTFLVEHAAPPRYVWLIRNLLWLIVMFLLMAAFSASVAILITSTLLPRGLLNMRLEEWYYYPPSLGGYAIASWANTASSTISLVIFGSLAAFSIGQCCSMLLRSEIMSVFLAVVLATALGAWVAILYVWQLSAPQFLLPVTFAGFLTTYFYAPYWLAGLSDWRWRSKSILVATIAIAVTALMLPIARLNQVWRHSLPGSPTSSTNLQTKPSDIVAQVSSTQVAEQAQLTSKVAQKWKADGEETAILYLKAAQLLAGQYDDHTLDQWDQPEYLNPWLPVAGRGQGFLDVIDEDKIRPKDRDAFQVAKKQWIQNVGERRKEAIELAMKASERIPCSFNFAVEPALRPQGATAGYHTPLEPNSDFACLGLLLEQLCDLDSYDSDIKFDRLLAGLHMVSHMANGQPTAVYLPTLDLEARVLTRIREWAANKHRTKEELADALNQLKEFRLWPQISGALAAERQVISDVIDEKQPAYVMNDQPVPERTFLAYMANRLPWERRRAHRALELITFQNDVMAQRLTSDQTPSPRGNGELPKEQFNPYTEPLWEEAQPEAATSYLVNFEFKARVPIDRVFRRTLEALTCQRATLLDLALLLYRQEHGGYPPDFEPLVPTYFKELPRDPFSGEKFQYYSQGLPKPLEYHWWSEGRGERMEIVEPNTPIFWSVGPYRLILKRGNDRVSYDADDPDAGSTRTRKDIYLFNFGTEYYAGDNMSLVFELPK